MDHKYTNVDCQKEANTSEEKIIITDICSLHQGLKRIIFVPKSKSNQLNSDSSRTTETWETQNKTKTLWSKVN
ncbi:hypothetical protein BpHYR1_031409 [Brachionus plicatilis]|uniref:Uncharacterized protein n=1 Tax=Brachionus plicatilis TaxID=10195 RepID=A0A3M7QDS0_BRAPC|nr:hypothetical protein BpHYR1_031409 [Brachionus plicatilis]